MRTAFAADYNAVAVRRREQPYADQGVQIDVEGQLFTIIVNGLRLRSQFGHSQLGPSRRLVFNLLICWRREDALI